MATDKETIREASKKYWEKKRKEIVEEMGKENEKTNCRSCHNSYVCPECRMADALQSIVGKLDQLNSSILAASDRLSRSLEFIEMKLED